MTVERELGQTIRRAGSVEELQLLPPKPSFFQRKTVEVITDVVSYDIEPSSWAFQATCKETVERLLPLVDFLTRSRSIQEFQDLKRGLIEIIRKDDPDLREVVSWLGYLLPAIKIFPEEEKSNISMDGMDPEEIWKGWEKVNSRQFRRREDKIVSFDEVVKLAEQYRQTFEKRVGYAIGKWRLGPHSEHIKLFQEAKEVLGWDDLLIVGVESQRSIWQRRGRDHFALPDDERLERITALEAVDCAVLFNPSNEELGDLNGFYRQADRRLYRDLWFIGTSDYHWRSEFEMRCRELGMILLWKSPTGRFSATQLIGQIRKAS